MILTMGDPEADERPGAAQPSVDVAVGRAIRELLSLDGRTQEVFVAPLKDGLSLKTLQRIMSGGSCTVTNLVDIARELGVDPVVILVRAGLSAEILDPVSAVSQAGDIDAEHRRAIIQVIRLARESPKAGAQ